MSISHPAKHRGVDAISFNPLWLPGKQPTFMPYTILGGQTLKVGSVLGRITASGKLKLTASAAGDGSEVPLFVLQEPLATFAADGSTPADMVMAVATSGSVNETALVYGAGHTASTIREALRAAGFVLRSPGYSG